MLQRFRQPWTDRRAELSLGALACLVLLVILFMVVFVAIRAWPSFHANGLSWFSAKGNVDNQLDRMVNSGANPTQADYQLGAWPLIYATALTTIIAVALGLVFSVLSAIFIVEFAPERIRRIIVPIVRLLAAVPSVIYGLIGILVFVPLVGNHIITRAAEDVRAVRHPAHGRQPARRRPDPDRDDHADHGGVHRRRPVRDPAVVA